MSLYFWLNILSISVPFLVSFHPRLKLYRKFKYLFLSLVISMLPYIIWDIYFTEVGFWGFNETYLSGLFLFGLPAEEWMFFICIPYACIFTHYSLLELNPGLKVGPKSAGRITGVLLVFFLLLGLINFDKAYTLTDSVFAFLILGTVYKSRKKLLEPFYVTFLFMLIPFFIVNGILTGSGIEGEVVWYDNAQTVGIRLFTIPAEDTIYAFSMILLNLFLFDRFTSWSQSVENQQLKK